MILAILFNYPAYRLEDVLRLTPERLEFLIGGLALRNQLVNKERKKEELRRSLHEKLGWK